MSRAERRALVVRGHPALSLSRQCRLLSTVEAQLRGSDRSYVTDWTLKAERRVIAAMKAGLGAGEALAGPDEVAAHLAGAGLTAGQEEAVRTVLLSRDRVVGVQGWAGTGKTTMLRHVRELSGECPVVGLAPSAAAARVLERETGMNVRTLQWFLTRCGSAPGDGGAEDRLKQQFGGSVVVLDEASMVSTDQMGSLMRIADRLGAARLALVGDTRQLRAVEAGQPFLQLQRAGMATAQMDEFRRQRDPVLRAAVLASRSGEPGKAVELLGSSMHEVAYDELGEAAARTWLALAPEARERTLLLAPTHALRAEVAAIARGRVRLVLEDGRRVSLRVIANGEALLADLGAQAGDAGGEIRDGLGRLPALHALDDAHRAFESLRDEVAARAAAEDTIPYYAEGHDALLESARVCARSVLDGGVFGLFDGRDAALC